MSKSYESKTRKIDFTIRTSNLLNDAKEVYTKIRPDVSLDEIEAHELDGGYVNSTICLSDTKGNSPIVMRVYALKLKSYTNVFDNTALEDVHDRVHELAVVERSSELNVTAKLIARFNNGLIIEYIDGHNIHLDTLEMRTVQELARKLARFHTIKLDNLTGSPPAIDKFMGKANLAEYDKKTALYDKRLEELGLKDEVPPFSKVVEELRELDRIFIEKNVYGSKVLSHNDLNKANIVVDKTTKEPFIIDLETANINYQMFDMAHFFIEIASKKRYNWSAANIPDDEFKKIFLRSYYEEWNNSNGIQMNRDEFDKLINFELKKLIVNMLLARIYFLHSEIYYGVVFVQGYSEDDTDETVNFYIKPLYKDYIENKEKDLKLIC